MTDDSYLSAEDRARVEIDEKLRISGWIVQNAKQVNLSAGPGVAVREFVLNRPHGRADYLLFLDGRPVGAIEAKPAGTTLTEVELQTGKYGDGLPDGIGPPVIPLPFRYESTGKETRFTNFKDPEPRSRVLFDGYFHRPAILHEWLREMVADPTSATFRGRVQHLPPLDRSALWPAQGEAITNLEQSLCEDRPRALIQMATGSGKTYTAANIAYRLIKDADASRILFLVDRGNLGKQTKKEFQQFDTPGDGRKFTELYNIQHLQSNSIDLVSRVCIATVQRVYSILKGEAEMDSALDEQSLDVLRMPEPVPVEYNPRVPMETFDIVIVDECHRSIYGLWRQVIEYFDAHIIGLTATPTKQTFGFFNQNLVMEYSHDKAVADNVNVDYSVYSIKTAISQAGSTIDAGLVTGFRNRHTRTVRWSTVDAPLVYSANQLDRSVVAKDQMRTIIRTFRDRLFTEIFPGRTTVPKTLIFAKDDSHADDIVQIVREEFGKGNDFCQKITYRTIGHKTDDLIQAFRTSLNPRIVVTVDMIATGTDIKPLECLLFMRDVKSRTYFEQMVGRGVRVINDTDFQAVTPDATMKDRFVIVDAVGVTETPLLDTIQPLDRQPRADTGRLLNLLSYGNREIDLVSTIASRLVRLNRHITQDDRIELAAVADGVDLSDITHALVDAIDPDTHLMAAQQVTGKIDPSPEEIASASRRLIDAAVVPLSSNPELRQKILDLQKSYEQTIDETSQDTLLGAGYSEEARAKAGMVARDFRVFIEEHKDSIRALQILYSQPYKERLTHAEVKELANALARPPKQWTPERLWQAYETLDRSKVRGSGERMLTDVVSLVRFALEQELELIPFRETVDTRFETWLAMQEQTGKVFTAEQRRWLTWMKDFIAAELSIDTEALDYTPFSENGGLGRAVQVFGNELEPLMNELSEALAA